LSYRLFSRWHRHVVRALKFILGKARITNPRQHYSRTSAQAGYNSAPASLPNICVRRAIQLATQLFFNVLSQFISIFATKFKVVLNNIL